MSPSTRTSIGTLLAILAAKTIGHGIVTGIVADGVYHGGFIMDHFYIKANTGSYPDSVGWYHEAVDLGFVAPNAFTTEDIVCSRNSETAKLSATVAAGGTVDFQWTNWVHFGVVMTYAALCPGECTDPALDKTALKFVKIDEGTFNTATQKWATDDMIANNNTWSVKVPSTLPAGNYVFRHETIAFQGAGGQNGAQNYPQCVNMVVTGSGTASPPGVAAQSLYTPTDPGLLFNPYTKITSYTSPGPALMAGGFQHTLTGTAAGAKADSGTVVGASVGGTSDASTVASTSSDGTSGASTGASTSSGGSSSGDSSSAGSSSGSASGGTCSGSSKSADGTKSSNTAATTPKAAAAEPVKIAEASVPTTFSTALRAAATPAAGAGTLNSGQVKLKSLVAEMKQVISDMKEAR